MTKEEFKEAIINSYLEGKKIVLVNIGTEKLNGDSFGPLLGSMLKDKLNIIKVYGTLDEPINAVNIEEKINKINAMHKNDLIIGVDGAASRCESDYTEDFIMCNESFIPGAGLGKALPEVGHICIKFCVKKNKDDEDVYDYLRKFSIKDIYNRSRKAAEFIFDIDEELEKL